MAGNLNKQILLFVENDMISIEYVTPEDKDFWFGLDIHLADKEFCKKVRDKQGYVFSVDGIPGGFTVDIPGYEQPMEMFMSKAL